MSRVTEQITGEKILEITMGNCISEILLFSVSLNIYDHLESPLTSDELAEELNIPSLHLGTLLDACCALKLLDKTIDEIKPDFKYGTYQNNRLSSTLLRSVGAYSLKDMVLSGVTAIDATIAGSAKALITGKKTESMYKIIELNPELRKTFHDFMKEISKTAECMTKVFDLSSYSRMCDLGGSTGNLARKFSLDYPEMNVSVLELEEITKLANMQPENKDSKINFIPGSFFDQLPACDLYSLSHVLHNWDDAECILILNNVFNHLPQGGSVLILDSIVNEDRIGPMKFNLSGMAQLDGHCGHHRTLKEFENILQICHFGNIRYQRTREAGYYDAIIATK